MQLNIELEIYLDNRPYTIFCDIDGTLVKKDGTIYSGEFLNDY